MTTSNVFVVNSDVEFEEQTNAVRGLLSLVNDGVQRMEGVFSPDVASAICDINAAVISWMEEGLSAELKRRSSRVFDAKRESVRPFAVAAE